MSNPENPNQPQGTLDIDYRETTSITHVHSAIQREKREPLSNSVPIPLWLMGIYLLIFAWGFYYLGEFNGGYSADGFSELAGMGSAKSSAGANGPAQPETVVQQGEKVFKNNCATCHQLTGLGNPGQYPPLAGSEFVNGTPARLAMILLKGLQGPVTVKGNTFNGQMPTWTTLTDKQISAVLTYVRQEWGNKGDEVYAQQISKARAKYKDRSDPWTAQDILNMPANAVLEGAPPPEAAPGASPAASGTMPPANSGTTPPAPGPAPK